MPLFNDPVLSTLTWSERNAARQRKQSTNKRKQQAAPATTAHTQHPWPEPTPPMHSDEDDPFEPPSTEQQAKSAPPVKVQRDTQCTTNNSWLDTDDYPDWLLQIAGNRRRKKVKRTIAGAESEQNAPQKTSAADLTSEREKAPALYHPQHITREESCFGTIDLSQCILTEPSILTKQDFDAAREHLKNQLHNNPQDHRPPTPAPTRKQQSRECNTIKPTYDIDRLLNIDTFKMHGRLHFLRKSKRFGVGISTSIIPNAGRGLFKTRDRSDTEFICPYLGAQVKKSNDTPTGEYSYYDTTRGIVLIGNPATSYGPYANDPLDEQKANCKIAWRQELQEYWLKAQGPIAASTELLLMYGHEFWEWHGALQTDIINKAYPPHLLRPLALADEEKC